MSSAPVNHETLESLRELMEDEFDELVENYIDDTRILLDNIKAAVEDGNAVAIQNEAHAMKSSSGNMGAIPMSELAMELEQCGRSGDVGQSRTLWERAETEFSRVREALSVELQGS